jgi:hypothetical protein
MSLHPILLLSSVGKDIQADGESEPKAFYAYVPVPGNVFDVYQ